MCLWSFLKARSQTLYEPDAHLNYSLRAAGTSDGFSGAVEPRE